MFVCRRHSCQIFSVVHITSFSDTNNTITLFQSVFRNVKVLFLYTECLNIYVVCRLGSRTLRRNEGQHSNTWSTAKECQVKKHHFHFEATANENQKPQTAVCEQDTPHKQAIETQPHAEETEPIHGNKHRRQYTRVCRRNFASKKRMTDLKACYDILNRLQYKVQNIMDAYCTQNTLQTVINSIRDSNINIHNEVPLDTGVFYVLSDRCVHSDAGSCTYDPNTN